MSWLKPRPPEKRACRGCADSRLPPAMLECAARWSAFRATQRYLLRRARASVARGIAVGAGGAIMRGVNGGAAEMASGQADARANAGGGGSVRIWGRR